jgi:hypothetical protein
VAVVKSKRYQEKVRLAQFDNHMLAGKAKAFKFNIGNLTTEAQIRLIIGNGTEVSYGKIHERISGTLDCRMWQSSYGTFYIRETKIDEFGNNTTNGGAFIRLRNEDMWRPVSMQQVPQTLWYLWQSEEWL